MPLVRADLNESYAPHPKSNHIAGTLSAHAGLVEAKDGIAPLLQEALRSEFISLSFCPGIRHGVFGTNRTHRRSFSSQRCVPGKTRAMFHISVVVLLSGVCGGFMEVGVHRAGFFKRELLLIEMHGHHLSWGTVALFLDANPIGRALRFLFGAEFLPPQHQDTICDLFD